MKNNLWKDGLMWGVILWLIGYVLGIILFMVAPTSPFGWLIMPIGVIVTLWVLLKKIKGCAWGYHLIIAIIWTVIAVVLDYLLLVRAFNTGIGYYKLDVYIYYALTFLLPLIVCSARNLKKSK